MTVRDFFKLTPEYACVYAFSSGTPKCLLCEKTGYGYDEDILRRSFRKLSDARKISHEKALKSLKDYSGEFYPCKDNGVLGNVYYINENPESFEDFMDMEITKLSGGGGGRTRFCWPIGMVGSVYENM